MAIVKNEHTQMRPLLLYTLRVALIICDIDDVFLLNFQSFCHFLVITCEFCENIVVNKTNMILADKFSTLEYRFLITLDAFVFPIVIGVEKNHSFLLLSER